MAIRSRNSRGSDYTRFFITGRGRTGTTWLQEQLTKCHRIFVYGEVLNKGFITKHAVDDPVRFFEEGLFCEQKRVIQAVGVKLLYDQFFVNESRQGFLLPYWTINTTTSPEYIQQRREDTQRNILRFASIDKFGKRLSEFRDYVRNDKSFKVIHLKRRNILAAHLSAHLSTNYSWIGKPIPSTGAVALDYEDCVAAFEATRFYERYFDDFFSEHDTMELSYEDLCAAPEEVIERVYGFLQVQDLPRPEVNVQVKEPLSRRIANFEELKRRFAPTRWAEFFDETPAQAESGDS